MPIIIRGVMFFAGWRNAVDAWWVVGGATSAVTDDTAEIAIHSRIGIGRCPCWGM